MGDVVTVKMKTLFGEEFEIIEEKTGGRSHAHAHDNVRCMHAKGIKCTCKCHAVYHGIVRKRKIEKLDKFIKAENEASFSGLEYFKGPKMLEAPSYE